MPTATVTMETVTTKKQKSRLDLPRRALKSKRKTPCVADANSMATGGKTLNAP